MKNHPVHDRTRRNYSVHVAVTILPTAEWDKVADFKLGTSLSIHFAHTKIKNTEAGLSLFYFSLLVHISQRIDDRCLRCAY